MSNKEFKQYTLEEVSKHNTDNDCWIVVDGKVYDVTKFAKFHPGGKKVILKAGGTDASEDFAMVHHANVLTKYKRLVIGEITRVPRKPSKMEAMVMGMGIELPLYGELVPFGDPTWYQGWNSPYYNDTHKKLRHLVRHFVEKEITPKCRMWDEAKKFPRELLLKAGKVGILPAVCGPPWPEEYVPLPKALGITADEFDCFHELVIADEASRCGSGGVLWGLFGGLSIGLPPVLHHGSDALKEKVIGPCLRGEKIICLAITEPWGGSDVANLRTTAELTPDGKHYIVNGEKKWITNGVYADFFTVACRTGGKGMGGVSLLLVERGPGVTTKQMNCMGVWSSGTTYITFEDAKVPVENLIGKENRGFRYIMQNFNHERWAIIAQANRLARVCLEEAVKFAMRRKTFGKKLIDHPVIRAKIAEMARHVMSTHAALESLTYQMNTMPKMQQMFTLGGATALLKVQATRTFELCAREAAQILGGASYTRNGPGEKVERLYREVRAYAIPGGSEEIMADLGVRQSVKLTQMAKKFMQRVDRKGESKL